MHARRRTSSSIAVVVAGIVLLAGCAAEQLGGAPGGGAASAAAPGVAPTSAAPADERDPDTEPTNAPDASVPKADDPIDCLLGTWTADNDFFLAQMKEFGDEITGVTGAVMLTFGDYGELVTEYHDWTISARSDGADITIVRSGTDRGTYSALAEMLSITETQMGTSISVSGGGMQMSIPTEPAVYTNAAYTCGPSSAVVTTADGAMTLTR